MKLLWTKLKQANAQYVAAKRHRDELHRDQEMMADSLRILEDGYGRELRALLSRRAHKALGRTTTVGVWVRPLVDHSVVPYTCTAQATLRWYGPGGQVEASARLSNYDDVELLLERFNTAVNALRRVAAQTP